MRGRIVGFTDYDRDICDPELDVEYILDRYYHSGASVAFIGADLDEEADLKRSLAVKLAETFQMPFHPLQLVICGSAHLGFSPVVDGERYGRSFDPRKSDIDVAVIHAELFERCWGELQDAQSGEWFPAVADNLFYGLIDPSLIRGACSIGASWWELFGSLKTARAKGIRGRLYRNHWSMQRYHSRAIRLAIERFRPKTGA